MECPNDLNKPCKCTGHVIKLLDTIAEELNFTYSCYKPQNKANFNQTIVNKIKTGVADFGLPIFLLTQARFVFMDYVFGVSFFNSAIAYPQDRTYDLRFFNCVFNGSVWIVVMSMVLTAIIYKSTLEFYMNYSETQSHCCLVTSFSLMFVILYAYFGGAITMIASTRDRTKFHRLTDIAKHPEWDFRHMRISSYLFKNRLKISDEQYNCDVTCVPTSLDGLMAAKNGKIVYFGTEVEVRYNIFKSYENKVNFGDFDKIDPKKEDYFFLFPIGSPLQEGFKHINLALYNKGISETILPKRLKTDTFPKMIITNLNDLNMVYMALFGAFAISIGCLMLEKSYVNLYKHKRRFISK
nr:uncharacterized protein LOC121126198 [Lepeophtheirus salmonis]